MFEETRKQISLAYLPRIMAYINEHDPALYDEILVTEMRLDDLWLSMRKGKDTLEQFKETLRVWKTQQLTVIDIYRRQRDWRGEKQRGLF